MLLSLFSSPCQSQTGFKAVRRYHQSSVMLSCSCSRRWAGIGTGMVQFNLGGALLENG